MYAQTGLAGVRVVWSCFGLCSGRVWLDIAVTTAGLVLFVALARALRRARAARGHGNPGRVVGFGGVGVVASLPFLASAFGRLCVTNPMGVALGCRLEVMGLVLLQGLALLAIGIGVASVGRDLRETRGPAPLGRRRV